MRIDISVHELTELQRGNNQAQQKIGALEDRLVTLESEIYTKQDKIRFLQTEVDRLNASAFHGSGNPANDLKLVAAVMEAFGMQPNNGGGPYNKIRAIKKLRELTGCGLKEAKDAMEGVYGKPGFSGPFQIRQF